MKPLFRLLGTAALGVAVLLTFLLAVVTELFTLRPPNGPDSMGLIVVLVLPVAAWLLVLVAALAASGLGAFAWVSPTRGVPTLAVLVTVVGLGGLSVAAAVFSLEVEYASRTAAGLAGGLVLPLAVGGFVGYLLWTEPASGPRARWLRPVGATLGALALVAWAGGFAMLAKGAADDARRQAAERAEEAAREEKLRAENAALERKQDAELAALPDDAPIELFLAHLFIDKSEEHHRKAVARIRSLPDLPARLAARLEHPEPLQREYVLNFVKMAGTPDPAWEPAVRAAVVRLAADYRAEAKDRSRGRITHVKGLTWGALLAAQTFGPKRFDEEARDLRAAVSSWPEGGERDEALGLLDLYLAGTPVPE